MIPAILSCIFVIYLYHTLNQNDDSMNAGNDQPVTPAALSARVARLQERIDELSKGAKS